MTSKPLEFYENESLPDPEIDAERQDETRRGPAGRQNARLIRTSSA